MVCACGQTLQQWSVTQGAAIRAWNRNLALETDTLAPSREAAASRMHPKG